MKEDPSWKNSRIVAILGIIASIITIFVFLTGLASISDVLTDVVSKNNDVHQEYIYPETNLSNDKTRENNQETITPIVSSSPFQQPTLKLTSTPVIVNFDSDYVKIEMIEGKPGVDIQVIAVDKILPNVSAEINKATKDALGNWYSEEEYNSYGEFDSITGLISKDLPIGTYGVTSLIGPTNYMKIFGRWGVPCSGNAGRQIIPFSVVDEMRTKITISLGVIRVLVVDSNNHVDMDDSIIIICQAIDANGDYIKSSDCHNRTNDDFEYPQTDRRNTYGSSPEGYRYFFVGSGYYLISRSNDILAFDLSVSPNELIDIEVLGSNW